MSDALVNWIDWVSRYSLPCLALIATVLGFLGDTWDEISRRPTRLGYWLLAVGGSIAATSMLSTCTGDVIKAREQEAALAKQAVLLLPLRYVELWIPRTQVAKFLPVNVAAEETLKAYRLVGFSREDSMAYVLSYPKERGGSMLDRVGEAAKQVFDQLYASVCPIEIYPAALGPEEATYDESIRDTDRLIEAELTRTSVIFKFKPAHLPTVYLQDKRFRLLRSRRLMLNITAGSFVQSESAPPVKPCAQPSEVKLVAAAFGYQGTTNFFTWKLSDREIESPTITFEAIQHDQHGPAPNSLGSLRGRPDAALNHD